MTRTARILVLRGGAIGDFIVTLPALAALRFRWPDSHIELIGYPHVARLALASKLIDHIRPLSDPGLARYFAPDAPIREADEHYFRSFDFIVQYLHDPGGVLRENLKRCGVSVLIEASPLVRGQHATGHFLQPLESLAIYGASPIPRLTLPGDAGTLSPGRIGLAIHPGSGSRKKNWPLEHFVDLARRARAQRGLNATFITGDAEQAYISGLDAALHGFDRLHQVELVALAGMLRRAGCYVGNDSGISHLAAALGIPTLVLFGPSDPSGWAPRGPRVKIVQSDPPDLRFLPADTVWDALVNLIDAPS